MARRPILLSLTFCVGLIVFGCSAPTKMPQPKAPIVGQVAGNFELMTLGGERFELADAVKNSAVVLVVLRGYPGYQCPICSQQVADLMNVSEQLAASDAQVALVYPGEASNLSGYAEEFMESRTLPKNFNLLLDPKMRLVNAYQLRWNSPNETAYPTTIIIEKGGKIAFVKVGKQVVDRVPGNVVIEVLQKLTQ